MATASASPLRPQAGPRARQGPGWGLLLPPLLGLRAGLAPGSAPSPPAPWGRHARVLPPIRQGSRAWRGQPWLRGSRSRGGIAQPPLPSPNPRAELAGSGPRPGTQPVTRLLPGQPPLSGPGRGPHCGHWFLCRRWPALSTSELVTPGPSEQSTDGTSLPWSRTSSPETEGSAGPRLGLAGQWGDATPLRPSSSPAGSDARAVSWSTGPCPVTQPCAGFLGIPPAQSPAAQPGRLQCRAGPSHSLGLRSPTELPPRPQ